MPESDVKVLMAEFRGMRELFEEKFSENARSHSRINTSLIQYLEESKKGDEDLDKRIATLEGQRSWLRGGMMVLGGLIMGLFPFTYFILSGVITEYVDKEPHFARVVISIVRSEFFE